MDVERTTVDIRPFMLVAKIADHIEEMNNWPVRLASIRADKRAYEAGRESRVDDAGLELNPYRADSFEWQLWRSGWRTEDLAIRLERHRVMTAVRSTYTYGH
jgi:hypothetical protein